MPDSETLLGLALAILVGLAAWTLRLLKAGVESAVKSTAEEAAKATVRELQWPAELGRELQKTRGVERQELRYASYGALWKELRPLAIYDTTVIDRPAVHRLSQKLTDWYFSAEGGLLLTSQSRDFYFALQDLLRTVAQSREEWTADRSLESEGEQRGVFRGLLASGEADDDVRGLTTVSDYFSARVFDDWQSVAREHGMRWRRGVARLATRWHAFDNRERFATLQQVGSILRTSLANDVESRLR